MSKSTERTDFSVNQAVLVDGRRGTIVSAAENGCWNVIVAGVNDAGFEFRRNVPSASLVAA